MVFGGPAERAGGVAVETLAELAAALQRLRGTRSYADLDRAVRPRRLARSTVSNLLNGTSLPTRETLVLFLTACGVDGPRRQEWLAAWERIGTGHLPHPAGAVRVREARPRLLGVHAAIRVAPADGDLPPYVPRDLDPGLRSALSDAAAHGGFVLLVGGSSVGKTRTLVEAVRAVLPEWWLLHPGDADAVCELADDPPRRTVVWLDELQRHLDGLTAGVVRRLIAGGTVLVATLWPDEYGARIAPRIPGRPDPHRDSRAVLELAEVRTVPAALSDAERHRAEALAEDRRIRTALDTPDAGFTQVLAAGPHLIRWWEDAPGPGRAVITAALDARRVGARAPVTPDLLEAAAPGYLTATERAAAPPDWLDRALAYATTPLHGATAALCPVAADMGRVAGYVVADYLHQHARRVRRTTPLPDSAWQALVDHHDPGDTKSITHHAQARGRPDVATALDPRAARWSAELTTTDPTPAPPPEPGDLDELRERATGGDVYAAARAAGLLRDRGDLAAAVSVLRPHIDADRYAAYRADQFDRAEWGSDLFGEIMTAWVDHLADLLSDLLRLRADVDGLARFADAGHHRSADHLGAVLAEQGREDDLRRRTDPDALRHLAALLIGQGRVDEALALLRPRIAAWGSDRKTLDVLARADLLDELRALADDGNWHAAQSLVAVLAEQGRVGELHAEMHAGTPGAARAAGRHGA